MASDQTATPSNPAARLRVLVVEDESLVAMFLEDVLEDLGHEMLGPYSRVDAALPAAQSETFDVAILDVNVNGQAIFPVADAIASRGLPFIFSTGYGQKSLPEQYRSRPTLDKPFLPSDVESILGKIVTA
ncbi:MAG TPA: response regulator [Ferrovibrio sp.]|jgi:CheY-like chemotaxis protein|uniref:response regulator n=1 Tax=Ferrovibrio sp. TaxID=1917215 RepID=UPI002B4ABA0C|nr:response regulator [Ferrovibrio sp.]HLT77371.1 response regulator [Ferrovibrio sp.]